MKIEVWSDVMCPLCYIGKTNLETALEQFEHKDKSKSSIDLFSYSLTLRAIRGKIIMPGQPKFMAGECPPIM